MSYIRAKQIPPGSGNWYDYEVKSVWNKGKVIQQHIRYIGRSSKVTSPRSMLVAGGLHSHPSDSPIPPKPDNVVKMKTPAKLVASAMGMYYGGMPLDAIQQQFRQDHKLDMSESNYWNWVTRFTKEAVKQASSFKPNVGNVWIADETYMKLGKRNVYFWDIIDADTRYLLATHVSFSRSGNDAKRLMTLARRRAGKAPSTVVTDGLKSYIVGVEEEFGADSKHKQGSPFNVENNTNLIERFHRTLQQRTEVFAKYKNLADIRLLTNGWLINYNFMKQHEGAGNIPPAQAMSKVVPFKDWNDIIRAKGEPDFDYKVSLYERPSTKKRVVDATLTPILAQK